MFAKFKTEKTTKYTFIVFLVIIFLFFCYLSIPSLFKFDKLKTELENKIYNQFSLNVTLSDNINYVFFPSPRIVLKNIKIYDFQNNKKIFSKKNNIIINLNISKLLEFEDLDFKSFIIDNGLFNIQYSEINNLNNFLSKKLSKKNIKITDSKVLVNEENKLLFLININRLKIFHKNNYNRVSFGTKIFGTNFNGHYNKSFNKFNKSSLQISLPKLGFTSKSMIAEDNEEVDKKNFINTIIQYPKTRIKIFHEFYNNKLNILNFNIDSKLIDGSMKGYINFDPFYFDLNLDINQIYFIKIISNKINNLFKIDNYFPINNKINGKLNIDVKKFDSKSYMVDSGVINLELKNGVLDLKNINLSINKTGNLRLKGFILQQGPKINLVFDSSLNIREPKKFGSQLMLPSRKKLKRINIFANGKYDIKNYELNFDQLSVNGRKIDRKKSDIYSQKTNDFLSKGSLKDKFNLFKLRFFVKRLLE